MTKRPGFTLIELAIVLVIIGLIASMLLPSLVSSVKRGKTTEARATLYAVRDGVIGYALAKDEKTRKLPDDLSKLGNPVDPWKNAIQYWPTPALKESNSTFESICNATNTTASYKTPEGNVTNVAFVLSSNGPNSTQDVALGEATDARGGSDDLLLYVTLPHLKTLLCEPK